ncbi:MAG: SIMPL domain-containing protein, partial [Sporichthyaceae bacterium]
MRHSLRRYAAPVAAAAVLSAIAASIIVGSSTGSSVADESAPSSNTVSVNGLGRVAGVPDVLRLEIGVQRNGNDVNAALNAANEDVKRIKSALDRYDVADKDIQTSQVSINPRYVGDGRVEGYEIFQSLTVKLRDLKRSGAAISDAAEAGGNATRINGVSFDIEDNAKLISDARDAAFADAKAKAEQYAK